MKLVAWLLAVVMIMGTVGCASYKNGEVNSPAMGIPENETIQVLTNEPPADDKKIDVSFELDVKEEKDLVYEVKSVQREFLLDPKMKEELYREKMEQIKPIQGLFETLMKAAKAGDMIDINFSLKNISGKDLKISHGSGQRYNIWIYNEKDEEVYRWSHDKAFTQAIIDIEFGANDQLTFNEEWNLQDNEGNPVPTGKYTIVVMVMIDLKDGNISQDELTAKTIIEIE